jgi:hypothetical protein
MHRRLSAVWPPTAPQSDGRFWQGRRQRCGLWPCCAVTARIRPGRRKLGSRWCTVAPRRSCPPSCVLWGRPPAPVSRNGVLLSRRGRSVPANASGFDTHRDAISSFFDCSLLGWASGRWGQRLRPAGRGASCAVTARHAGVRASGVLPALRRAGRGRSGDQFAACRMRRQQIARDPGEILMIHDHGRLRLPSIHRHC